MHKKAAVWLHGLATFHGFNHANKRTAWLTTEVLCLNSGYDLAIHA
ncbi:Fic family protein [uncultured Tateyamaria sp.]